ncbi:MAG: ATP-dependent DNA helicase RecG [SAR202 cluster bacterium]|nr:ATP-dependent DNA helicase RecG [SAR202 cluster bacterium]|tara:strand:+ start:5564 stop:7945 length:2382 start_codon:yes stop_codon:yes gene_type:complete
MKNGSKNQEITNSIIKVLNLEAKLKFSDNSVIGGLDSLLKKSEKLLPWLYNIEPITGMSYSALMPGERQRWAKNVIQRINNIKTKKPSINITINSKINELKFLHWSTKKKLSGTRIKTLNDIFSFFPNRHINYSKSVYINDTLDKEIVTVEGIIIKSQKGKTNTNLSYSKILIKDQSGLASCTFFRQPYLFDKMKKGVKIKISGEVKKYNNFVQFNNPDYEIKNNFSTQNTHAGNFLPVYPSLEGIPQRTIRNTIRKSLDNGSNLINDFIPDEILKRNNFFPLKKAFENMHFPLTIEEQKESNRRLAFNELFLYQLLGLKKKYQWQKEENSINISDQEIVNIFMNSLKFSLTNDQISSVNEILKDINSIIPMSRLLQGEVGSGKTIVGICAILATVSSGYQALMMAPTEVLAEQHFINMVNELRGKTVNNLYENYVYDIYLPGKSNEKIKLILLTGSVRNKTKKEIIKLINNGKNNIVIGTHSLIQEKVHISNLGLVVIDEQHKFGVEQRKILTSRNPRPHLLAMSATPIPRTLSLTVYGDLNISTLRTLPKDRSEIETYAVDKESEINDAYNKIIEEVRAGRQAFIVCPLIEKSESIDADSAIETFELLKNSIFSKEKIALLHGKMNIKEKQDIMRKMRDKEIDILVSTPVIEIGVDIPNASCMVIMSSNRFGLAQLHQIRGRIGRGNHKSFCFLFHKNTNENSQKRIEVITENNDGFKISYEDMKLRGPGAYLGTTQSGWNELKFANIEDENLIKLSKKEAEYLFFENKKFIIKNDELIKQIKALEIKINN